MKGFEHLTRQSGNAEIEIEDYPVSVETGVAIPARRWRVMLGLPIERLGVGQSFFVPGDATKTKQMAGVASRASSRLFGGTRKFVTRSALKDGLTGVRLWRVK